VEGDVIRAFGIGRCSRALVGVVEHW
jgi:hypothetical protein